MTTETMTRKEACELIRSFIGKKLPEKDSNEFNKIVFAVNNDLTVRDFVISLPAYYDTQQVIDFLGHMSTYTEIGDDVPFITISGMIAYENDNREHFFKSMGYLSVYGNAYALHELLLKIARNQMPGEYLAAARAELAGKVMKTCYTEEPDYIIREEDMEETLTESRKERLLDLQERVKKELEQLTREGGK